MVKRTTSTQSKQAAHRSSWGSILDNNAFPLSTKNVSLSAAEEMMNSAVKKLIWPHPNQEVVATGSKLYW